jgi:hypothetical protein
MKKILNFKKMKDDNISSRLIKAISSYWLFFDAVAESIHDFATGFPNMEAFLFNGGAGREIPREVARAIFRLGFKGDPLSLYECKFKFAIESDFQYAKEFLSANKFQIYIRENFGFDTFVSEKEDNGMLLTFSTPTI